MPERDHPVVVFDLGGVLIDWDPRRLYRKMFDGDEAAVTYFLETVIPPDWNSNFDAGQPMAEGIAELSARHPDHAEAFSAWQARWPEMIAGSIEGTVTLLEALDSHGVELHAITNFSAETFPIAREMFGFLTTFRTITVSGEIGIIKPDRRIFDHFTAHTGVQPANAVFIDDLPSNIEAASALGFDAIHFTSPETLKTDLLNRIPGLPV